MELECVSANQVCAEDEGEEGLFDGDGSLRGMRSYISVGPRIRTRCGQTVDVLARLGRGRVMPFSFNLEAKDLRFRIP